MRSFVPAIYDCTVAVSGNQPPPTMLRIFGGKSSVVSQQKDLHHLVIYAHMLLNLLRFLFVSIALPIQAWDIFCENFTFTIWYNAQI